MNSLPKDSTLDRLSHSFPPTYKENTAYLAEVHRLFPKMDEEFNCDNVYVRPIANTDEINELR